MGIVLCAKFLLHTLITMQSRNSLKLRYTLLNDQGVRVPRCYIEIPVQDYLATDRVGKAMYHDFRGTTDPINFKWNQETQVFDAWHTRSPDNRFTMEVEDLDDGESVQLNVRFQTQLFHFALTLSPEDDEEVEYTVPAPAVHLVELACASF